MELQTSAFYDTWIMETTTINKWQVYYITNHMEDS